MAKFGYNLHPFQEAILEKIGTLDNKTVVVWDKHTEPMQQVVTEEGIQIEGINKKYRLRGRTLSAIIIESDIDGYEMQAARNALATSANRLGCSVHDLIWVRRPACGTCRHARQYEDPYVSDMLGCCKDQSMDNPIKGYFFTDRPFQDVHRPDHLSTKAFGQLRHKFSYPCDLFEAATGVRKVGA